MNELNPRVTHVQPRDDHQLELTFSNGERGVYDCRPLLDTGVFRELKELDYFRQARLVHGTVVWPNEQDLCPDVLYQESARLSAPESAAS